MSEILGGNLGLLDERVRRGIERVEGATQRRGDMRGHGRVERLQTGAQDTRVGFGEEQRGAPPAGRHGVAQLAGDAAHQALARQPAQVIAHLPGRVAVGRDPQQLRHHGPESAIREAVRRAGERGHGPQQRRDTGLAELQ